MNGYDVRPAALVAGLVLAAGPAASEGLEGPWRGAFNDLRLTVTGDAAVAEVRSGGCLGYLEGRVARATETSWEIVASVAEAPCTLGVRDMGDGRLEMIEGAGCSYYHGTSCELSGILEKAE